ncbi:MAG: hypothetical protein J5682_07430 [Prevotella sp.]|nr:hypothetical protein [Prevotella sp.]
MKKTYQQPQTLLCTIVTQNMFAASGPEGKKVYNDEQAGNGEYGLSRRNSFWDEEEEEEGF